ncbi:MAG: hypothetical protein IKQ45_05640 [Clostridia bacterium]|nr:hypothetical protein [Clostridia bacterium]
MKKTLAILLCLALLLGCAAAAGETAEKTYLATVDMNGAFQLQCALPEGYEIEEIESTGATYIAQFNADGDRPMLALSIAYNELYSGVQRMNELDAETLAMIEDSFRAEDDVDISYTETAYGTKLMMIKEVEGPVNYVDFYSVYLGYEIEIVVISQNETGLSDEQIRMAVDFLSELDFAAPEAETVSLPEGGKKFERDWAIIGGLAEIYYEEEGYRVTLTVDNHDGTGALWQYSCYYMENTDSLLSVSSSRTDFTINPDTGDTVYGDTVYEGIDEEGQNTEFTIDADGCLIWKDGHDDAGAGLKFADIGRFEGVWRNEAEEVEAQFMWNGLSEDEMFYTVYITRGKTDGDHYTVFLMNGTFDPATGKLAAMGTCTLFTRNASGEYESSEDGETYDAFFSMMEDGRLLFETANGIELEYDLMGAQS